MPDENGEPFGFELIHGTGSITTLDVDEDFLDEIERERRFPFGFQAPRIPKGAHPDVPALSSEAWDEWLTRCT